MDKDLINSIKRLCNIFCRIKTNINLMSCALKLYIWQIIILIALIFYINMYFIRLMIKKKTQVPFQVCNEYFIRVLPICHFCEKFWNAWNGCSTCSSKESNYPRKVCKLNTVIVLDMDKRVLANAYDSIFYIINFLVWN